MADVLVDMTTKVVSVVRALPAQPSVESLIAAVATVDFQAVEVLVNGCDFPGGMDTVATVATGATTATTTVLHVDGMKCMGNCGGKVKRALQAIDGVTGTSWRFPSSVVCSCSTLCCLVAENRVRARG